MLDFLKFIFLVSTNPNTRQDNNFTKDMKSGESKLGNFFLKFEKKFLLDSNGNNNGK